MADELDRAREDLIQELGHLSSFAGFNKAMGQIYGLLYLSMEPVSLGEIAEELGISKGNASLNIRMMERWRLLQPVNKKGDRRDYYQAETDFWKIVRDILAERDKKLIDHTLNSISNIYDAIKSAGDEEKNDENSFYQERIKLMLDFGNAVDKMVQAFLTLDNFRMSSLMRQGSEKESSRHIEIEE